MNDPKAVYERNKKAKADLADKNAALANQAPLAPSATRFSEDLPEEESKKTFAFAF